MATKVASVVTWEMWEKCSERLWVGSYYVEGKIIYVPLYLLDILLVQPHFQKDAERFNFVFSQDKPPDSFDTYGDMLKFYRYRRGLLQKDVAEMVGVSRSCYHRWENGGTVSEEMRGRLGGILDLK